MVRRTGSTNEHLRNLIQDLKALSIKQDVKIWKRIANDLDKSTRKRREVNVFKINMFSKENETIVVPGKVLADGNLDKKVKVAAFRFSEQAKEKINKAGKAISIQELMKENPKGNKVRIFG